MPRQELEVDRPKRLVTELLLDKTMLQDIAKKVVSPDQQRAAADYLDEKYGVSQRRISRVMGRSRSGLRYRRTWWDSATQDLVAPSFSPMKLRTCWAMASSVGSRSIELAP